jgi:glycyl-tRNA synthetase alpha subunit
MIAVIIYGLRNLMAYIQRHREVTSIVDESGEWQSFGFEKVFIKQAVNAARELKGCMVVDIIAVNFQNLV